MSQAWSYPGQGRPHCHRYVALTASKSRDPLSCRQQQDQATEGDGWSAGPFSGSARLTCTMGSLRGPHGLGAGDPGAPVGNQETDTSRAQGPGCTEPTRLPGTYVHRQHCTLGSAVHTSSLFCLGSVLEPRMQCRPTETWALRSTLALSLRHSQPPLPSFISTSTQCKAVWAVGKGMALGMSLWEGLTGGL